MRYRLDLQGVLQDNCRKCVAMFNICHFLTYNYVPNSGMKKTKCISVHIQITDFSYKEESLKNFRTIINSKLNEREKKTPYVHI